MKRLRILIFGLIILVCLFSNLFALDEFVRGIWLTGISGCGGYEVEGCCYNTINWARERELLLGAHVNLINAFTTPETEREWMDSICNYYGGQIKMYIGTNGEGSMGFVGLGSEAWQYPDVDWISLVEDTLQACYNEYGSDDGFFGYYLAHEWDYDHQFDEFYDGFEYMASYIHGTLGDTSHMTGVVNGHYWSDFSNGVPDLKIVELDRYVFPGWLADSGDVFQSKIGDLIQAYDGMNTTFINSATEWMPVIQVCACCWLGIGWGDSCSIDTLTGFIQHYPTVQGWPYTMRFCSREEIRLQAFLAISRGAKGVIVWNWGTAYARSHRIWGIVEHCYVDSARQIFLPRDHQDSTVVKFWNYDYGESPYQHLAELYGQLEDIGSTLLKLEVTDVGGYKSENDISNPDSITFIKAVKGDYNLLEAATFIDSVNSGPGDDIDYFMIINRITSKADTLNHEKADYQTATVSFTRPADTYPFIIDILSGEKWAINEADSVVGGVNYFHFTDSIGPGDGNIYKLSDALKDTIDGSLALSGENYVIDDLIIGSGDTLIINHGATIYINPDAAVNIKINGVLIADGWSNNRCKITSWNEYTGTPDCGNWNRISFGNGSYGDLANCDINYASYGIFLNDSSTVSLYGCKFEDCQLIGVNNVKSKLFATKCHFEDIPYGIGCNMARAIIDSCSFVRCKTYGVMAFYDHSYSDDSTFITNCDFRTGDQSTQIGSQYGIRATGINRIRIQNNDIRTYEIGGIYLYDSDGITSGVRANNCGSYGIYATNSCNGLITDCDFDSLNCGVVLNNGSVSTTNYCWFKTVDLGIRINGNAQPDLGQYAAGDTTEWGNNNFETCATYYIDQVASYNPGPLITAEMNYYGASVVPAKFRGNIDYLPVRDSDPCYKTLNAISSLPLEYSLSANYPNPFNPQTAISFSLAEPGYTTIDVFNILGQNIKTLTDEYKQAGHYTVIWDGTNRSGEPVASGVYLYRLRSGEFTDSKKMLLLR